LPSKKRPTPQEITVRKTIFSVLGATLLAASLMQTAAAAEHRHRATRADRAPRNAQVVAVPSVAEQEQEYWRARGLSTGGPSALRY
jgi:chemotaxis response regulator CheB